MNLESVVSDIRTRAEDVSNRAQNVAELSVDTVRKANKIVVPTVQNIVEKQGGAAREFVESGKSSVDRVRKDGLKAVASNPISYLPQGKSVFVDAFSSSVELTTKAGNDLATVLRRAYEDALARINGKKPKAAAAKKAVRKASTTARKTARKASTTARKTASKASKA